MNALFIAVLLMSVTGGLLVLCLSLLYPLTKKAFDSTWHYRICMLIVLFMLVPFGIAGGSFLTGMQVKVDQELPNVPAILNEMITEPVPNISSKPAQQKLSDTITVTPAETVKTAITIKTILPLLPFIWLAGVFVFATWQGILFVRFKKKIVRTSLRIEDTAELSALNRLKAEMGIKGNLRLFSNSIIKTPMLIGLFKTFLILPEVEMSERELEVILKHELIHYKRRDLWVKSLALAANAIHWFNPAAYLLTKNIDVFCELSCDERVVADMDMEERRFYGETILNVLSRVVSQYSGVYATLAESKKGIERRLTHMMNVRKNSKRIIVISLITAAVLCLTGCAVASIINMSKESASAFPDWLDKLRAGMTQEEVKALTGIDTTEFTVELLDSEAVCTLHFNFNGELSSIAYRWQALPQDNDDFQSCWQSIVDGVKSKFGEAGYINAGSVYTWVFDKQKNPLHYMRLHIVDQLEMAPNEVVLHITFKPTEIVPMKSIDAKGILSELFMPPEFGWNATISDVFASLGYTMPYSTLTFPDITEEYMALAVPAVSLRFYSPDYKQFELFGEKAGANILFGHNPDYVRNGDYNIVEDSRILGVEYSFIFADTADRDNFHSKILNEITGKLGSSNKDTFGGLAWSVDLPGESIKLIELRPSETVAWNEQFEPIPQYAVVLNMYSQENVYKNNDSGSGTESSQNTPPEPTADREALRSLNVEIAQSELKLQEELMETVRNSKRINAETPITLYTAQLMHDGSAQTIEMRSFDEPANYTLNVVSADGKILWSAEAGWSHAGWNTLLLTRVDGKDYLMKYNPSTYQGNSEYSFRVFSLDKEGNEILLDKDEVSFGVNPPGSAGEFHKSDIAPIKAFYEHVNSYLAVSELLISSDERFLRNLPNVESYAIGTKDAPIAGVTDYFYGGPDWALDRQFEAFLDDYTNDYGKPEEP